MKKIKVAVTGAAGQIGYSLLFRIASGEAFGSETEVELSLIELPEMLMAVEGVIMELQDCAFPLLKGVSVSADLKEGFKDVDWALLVGSVPRKAGMERNDLLRINGSVFVEQGSAINECAARNCKVLVVGNPCNTNALITKAMCPSLPEENFFALTMLDQNRAAAQLAIKASVDINDIADIGIWGNHSATQYPDFYRAKIQGKPALDVVGDEPWLQTVFIETIQKRGAEIINARGKSSAASAANAVIETIQKLIKPTPQGNFFSVAVCSDGSYGIEQGLIFSFPVQTDGEKWRIIQNIDLNEFARKKIDITREELLMEQKIIQEMFVK